MPIAPGDMFLPEIDSYIAGNFRIDRLSQQITPFRVLKRHQFALVVAVHGAYALCMSQDAVGWLGMTEANIG